VRHHHFAETGIEMSDAIFQVRISILRHSDSPRAKGIDADHVRMLAEIRGPLPPITVHRATMRVIDGMHRLAAARLMGRTEVAARFFEGTADEAFLLGVAENTTHGLPLCLADRRSAAARIMRSDPTQSNRSIAEIVGLAPRTVAAVRAGLEDRSDRMVRAGKDGRVRPLVATEGRLAASQAIAARPSISLREIARVAGVSVGTARDVRLRLLAGQDPLPDGRSGQRSSASKRARTTRPAIGSARSADLTTLLATLRRDPALRYSDPGRALLKWLDSWMVTMDQLPVTTDGIPVHCIDSVAAIARECARAWMTLAEDLTQH